MTDRPAPLGAEDHYRDARYYDHAYARYRHDIPTYVRLAVASGGPVLELGVGTGRVALEIADRGVEIVGVERMEPMLERARQRLVKRPARVRRCLTLVQGDLREVRLGRRFSLVISPFNVFQHLYERADIEGALATCREHLDENGTLIFDVLNPYLPSLARDPSRFYKQRPTKHPRDGRRCEHARAFSFDIDRQVLTTVLRFGDPTGQPPPFYQRLSHRQFFPEELRALLHYNGFEARLCGGFEGEPLDATADSIVVVAKARR